MSQEESHDLHDFMRQTSDLIALEYDRIQKRANEDPGTAGDQGEENWAEVLSGWLPSTYKVVTKGRIINQDGQTSPQVDVLVLKDVYPEKLLDKKLYLAAGVAAAFECKTTLKAEHIDKAIENSVKIKNLYPVREGTPYKELHTPIVYGLLSHSHRWKAPNSTPEKNIEQKLWESDQLRVAHPRQTLDLLCVADLGIWVSIKCSTIRQHSIPTSPEIQTGYVGGTFSHSNQTKHFQPIANLIHHLLIRLAWENIALRDLIEYYRNAGISGLKGGILRNWSMSVISDDVRRAREEGVRLSQPPSAMPRGWDEWDISFNTM